MIVARQFIAWDASKNATRPVGTARVGLHDIFTAQGRQRSLSTQSHRSLRDGSNFHLFQAMNCLATIIQSLRDNKPSVPVHIFDFTSLLSSTTRTAARLTSPKSLPPNLFPHRPPLLFVSEVGTTRTITTLMPPAS